MFDIDDKTLVIAGVVVLGLASMFIVDEPATIINQVITGLFALAVGRSTGR